MKANIDSKIILSNKNSGGFTIVELIVAMGLFLTALTIASAVFINILKSQRSLLRMNLTLVNTSLLLEQIAREIRTGQGNFLVWIDSNSDGNIDVDEEMARGAGSGLKFINAKGVMVVYKFVNNQIQKQEGSGSFIQMNTQNIKINSAAFNLAQCLPSDSCTQKQQPRITLNIDVSPAGPGLEFYHQTLQTTIDQRYVALPVFTANCNGNVTTPGPPTWTVQWSASVSGGASPYAYSWSGDGFNPGDSGETIDKDYSGTPPFTKNATVAVTDTNSPPLTTNASCSVTVQ